jgi:hypothetical protein
MSEYSSLKQFLDEAKSTEFPAKLGKGNYVLFKNSGKRGSVKEFSIPISSLLSGFIDIRNNLTEFQDACYYVEGKWRSLGNSHFSDLALGSMINVQTKPMFTLLSKIVFWAMDSSGCRDDYIALNTQNVETVIQRLMALNDEYDWENVEKKLLKKTLIDAVKMEAKSAIALSKPFILLAGISGTGKSRFVRKQAKASDPGGQNYCHVAVRPDWHEPSDLLGYVSRLGAEGPSYIATDVLKFIAQAWTAATESVDTTTGKVTLSNNITPYWLCLDEMNLAPVEQYFADFLSILETRTWENGEYYCEPLLKPDVITTLSPEAQQDLRKNLGMADAVHDALWESFRQHGIEIPPNLIVAGTVNMDETTHGFSRKVIDRAMTLDFGEFFPNDFDLFFGGQPTPKTLTYSELTQVTPADLADVPADKDGLKSVQFLKQVNGLLKATPFELAYRALNELLLSVVCFNPQNDAELKGIWDDFLMTKVLPRIEGDDDKLQTDSDDNNLLNRLEKLLSDDCFAGIQQRPDFFREAAAGGGPLMTELRSLKTLRRMDQRLRTQGFTAFWP